MISKLKIENFKLKILAKRSTGFTVLESIVAIAILSLSISGAFSSIQQSFSQAIIAKDEIKAFYLAQEAIEIVRNKRDSNQLNIINTGTGHWLSGIAENAGDPCFSGVCRTDATSMNFTYCGTDWGSCPVLNQDTNSGTPTYLYNYGVYPATNFKREIQIESVSADEIAVIVRITWSKGIINREFRAKAHFFKLI